MKKQCEDFLAIAHEFPDDFIDEINMIVDFVNAEPRVTERQEVADLENYLGCVTAAQPPPLLHIMGCTGSYRA